MQNKIEKKFWDIYAYSYSQLAKNYIPYQEVMSEVIQSVEKNKKREGETVLDVGCGTGMYIKKLNKLGYNTIGIDLSDSMLNKAKNEAGNPILILSDSSKGLPIRDGCIDQVISVNSLYVIKNQNNLINEFARVLQENGVLNIVNFQQPLNLTEMNKEYFKKYGFLNYLTMFKSQFINGICNIYIQHKMDNRSYHYLTKKEHKDMLEENGFKIISVNDTYICKYDVHIVAEKLR